MSLISDIFQQQQNIANNPATAIRTPQQVAYDNLLNKQYDIEQQNKNYNLYNGLASGIGGLGKILASTFVKNPYQQAGAMQGLSEQEQRLDNLRQAYENARMAQNKDYIQQAKDQLDMARDDEDKAYNRDFAEKKFAYEKVLNDIKNNQWQNEFDLRKDVAKTQIDKMQAEINDLENNPFRTAEQEQRLEILKLQRKKLEQETDPTYLEKKAQQEKEKADIDERNKKNVENIKLADTYAGREEITPELNTAIKKNPILGDYLVSSGKYNDGSYVGNIANAVTGGLAGKLFGTGKNPNKYTLDFAQIIREKTGIEPTKQEIAQLKKDLGLKDD